MKKLLLFLSLSFLLATLVNGQAIPPPPGDPIKGSTIVLRLPCANDGILVTKIDSGMTPPLTFYYQDNRGTLHSNIRAKSDTLWAISTCTAVTVTDSAKKSITYKTNINPPFANVNITLTGAVCPLLKGTASVTIIDGVILPDSVQWFTTSENGTQYSYTNAGVYKGTGNPINLLPVNYSAVIYYKGCFVSTYAYVQNIPNITVTIATTAANCTNGTAKSTKIVGGVAPYTYKWSTGETASEIGNLVSGTYMVTVTDSQGCYTVMYAAIKQAVTITVTSVVKDATCQENNGTVTAFAAGGTSPYTYKFSNGFDGQTVCCLKGGSYINVFATDSKGCTGNSYAYVKSTTPIVVTYSTKASSCTKPTGSATLTISGGTKPYNVQWYILPGNSDLTINNMPAGSYSFKVTDANGCVQTGLVVIPPQSTIIAVPSAIDALCPQNSGTAFMSVSGSNPPYSYAWNTGAITQSLKDVAAGIYYCTITDNIGCSVVKNVNVKNTSPVKIVTSVKPASCIYRKDGEVLAIATGGANPYTYSISYSSMGNPFKNLPTGNYYVYATDANGCTSSSYIKVGYNEANDSCYCTIKGKVYVDKNENCVYDNGEEGINHVMMHCEGFGYTFTDARGDYQFKVPTGKYTISETVQSIYPLANCQDNSVTVIDTAKSGCINVLNFANIINPLHDIKISATYYDPPRPGFNYLQGFIVQNDGTADESNIQLSFKHDGQLNYINSLPNLYTRADSINYPDVYGVTSGFPTLKPGEAVMIKRNFIVPTNIPLNTLVSFSDTASYQPPLSNWMLDYTPWNNVYDYETTVRGSFDPNEIEVSPVGKGNEGYISTDDSILTYTIHFENTGNYYAWNVVVTDTLDKNLDWNTVKPGYSNFNYTAEISETGVLKFTFKNLNLLWTSNNPELSKGLVTYTVKQKPGLSALTKINASAGIYFDYNEPVNTNKTLNTIELISGIKKNRPVKGIDIYPNPVKTDLNIYTGNIGRVKSIKIYDLTGRLLQQTNKSDLAASEKTQKANVSSLIKGIYFVELLNINGEKYTGKFIKE